MERVPSALVVSDLSAHDTENYDYNGTSSFFYSSQSSSPFLVVPSASH